MTSAPRRVAHLRPDVAASALSYSAPVQHRLEQQFAYVSA